MARWVKAIRSICPELLRECGFVIVLPYADETAVFLVRKLDEEVYAYLSITDSRPGGGVVDVELWFAPLASAGDTLESINLGFKILVARQYEIDESFLISSARRVRILLDCCDSFKRAVREELRNPPFRTLAQENYRAAMVAWRTVLQLAADGDEVANSLLQDARRFVKGRLGWSKYEERIQTAVRHYFDSGMFDPAVYAQFPDDPKGLALNVFGILTSYAAGELGKEQLRRG